MAFSVKKRANNRLNEIQKIQQPVDYLPNAYGDRFIPRRYALSRSSRFKAESVPDRKNDPLKMKDLPDYWRSHHYSAVLKELFGLVSLHDKILSFRDSTSRQVCKRLSNHRILEWIVRPTYQNVQKLDWSCHPRTKPVGFIEAVHDLPNIKTYFHKIIDWSVGGQIAAVFSKKLVIWSPNTDKTIGLRAQYTTSIAFNPTGDRLAVAMYLMNRPWLDILDLDSIPLGRSGTLKALDPIKQPVCYLTWDGSGQYVVCGFSNGQISIMRVRPTSGMNPCSKKYLVHNASITAIKFSCGTRYMASADEFGQLYIWHWAAGQLSPITRWISSVCCCFDWHPWREDEIVIADSEPMMIALFHVPSRQVVSYYQRPDCDCIVTTLSFNKISGELVVCYSYSDIQKPPEILVLASMDRVVDVMRNHDDVIMHLLWSPDGMQLASVGYDETLTIWNFFGISPRNDRRKLHLAPSVSSSSRAGTLEGIGRNVSRIPCTRNKEATYRDLASSFLFKAMR